MPKKRQKISQKVMLKAYEAAKSGKMSIREAAKKYKIPKSTLIDKVKGKSPLDSKKGPKQILTEEEEKALADWGVRMAGIGFTSVKNQVLYTVKTILDKDEKEGNARLTRFVNNMPGKDWWGRFCERHPKLRRANEQAIAKAKMQSLSCTAVEKWKSGLKKIYKRCNVTEPSCIFTCTVNRFQVDGRGIVSGCHIRKKLKERSKYLSVLTAASANGKFLPPMIVYPKDVMDEMIEEEEAVEGTFFTKSRNGDMNVELFYSWIGNHFVDYVPKGKNILLMIEGSFPYIDMYVSKLCKERNIILYCMPLRSQNFHSPLWVGFSKQVPIEWKLEAMNFELLNPGLKVDKYTFSAVFSNVWSRLALVEHITAAFQSCGIWPLGSKVEQRTHAVTDNMNVSCYDEEGNEIEVAMYEEVTSDHLPTDIDLSHDNEEETSSDIVPVSIDVLDQFEKSQKLTADQKELFERRYSFGMEEPTDLVYSAWKALKELVDMKPESDGSSDDESASEEGDNADDGRREQKENFDDDLDDDDDDDSLLDWLSDESYDDLGDEKENMQAQIKDLQRKILDEKVKLGISDKEDAGMQDEEQEEGVDEEENKREEEEQEKKNEEVDHGMDDPQRSSLSESSQRMRVEETDETKDIEDEKEEEKAESPHHVPNKRRRTSSPRTSSSPLKITRYKHAEETKMTTRQNSFTERLNLDSSQVGGGRGSGRGRMNTRQIPQKARGRGRGRSSTSRGRKR